MLVLTRVVGEEIRIGADIRIVIAQIDKHQPSGALSVKLGITAPPEISVLRSELKPAKP
jgi:carbon storage regulator CsrA